MTGHAQGVLAQLRQAEDDDDISDELRERIADRADELEDEIEEGSG